MLKHPDKFLPITTKAGLSAEVSTGWSGDFRVRLDEEFYLNPFLRGHTFLRLVASHIFDGPNEFEEVTNQELLKNLREAKDAYIRLYVE